MPNFLHISATEFSPRIASMTINIFCSEVNSRLVLRRMSFTKFSVEDLLFFVTVSIVKYLKMNIQETLS